MAASAFGLRLTLCGLTSQKTNQGGLGLSRSVHEEAHPCFPNFVYAPLEHIDARSTNCPLIQLIPSDDYSIGEKILTAVLFTPKFSKFPRMASSSLYIII